MCGGFAEEARIEACGENSKEEVGELLFIERETSIRRVGADIGSSPSLEFLLAVWRSTISFIDASRIRDASHI